MFTRSRLVAASLAVAAALALPALPAAASDHLSHSTDSPGAVERDFTNPVAANPSGTSGAAAQPTTVPGEGDPNAGQDLGTPSVDLGQVCIRSGHGLC